MAERRSELLTIKKRNSWPVSRVLCLNLTSKEWMSSFRCLSFIWTVCHHTALAFYPLAGKGYLFRMAKAITLPIYMNLQHPRCTASVSPHRWWALTPPSHLYLSGDRQFFSSALLNPRELLLIRKWVALGCPDFPQNITMRRCSATDRPTVSFAKI